MKKQIKRLSPHQNGKVFGILMAVATLPMFIPMMFVMSMGMPSTDQNGNPIEFPTTMFVMFPIMYLIFGYVSVAIMCFFYNLLQRFIGGFEYVTTETEVLQTPDK